MGMKAVVAPAKAGLLVTAKRGGDVAFAVAIDRDGARANVARRPNGIASTCGKHRRCKAVSRVIGDRTASSLLATSMTLSTGPKISSRARSSSALTSIITGATKGPSPLAVEKTAHLGTVVRINQRADMVAGSSGSPVFQSRNRASILPSSAPSQMHAQSTVTSPNSSDPHSRTQH